MARKPYTCVKEKSIIMHANDKIFNFDLHRTDESYLLAVVNPFESHIFPPKCVLQIWRENDIASYLS